LKKQLFQSANFKRDYVAALAIALFLTIVVSEIALAIAIPAYLFRENSMAFEVRRLNLIKTFDFARGECLDIKPRNDAAAMELRLVKWNLDRLAAYIRDERKNLTDDEITRLHEAVNQSRSVLWELRRGKSLSQEVELNTNIYVDSLIPKNGVK